ncbi:putative ribonuclease H-like domain-containing protein, partial [Tanacetum coccineum]
LSTFLLKNGYRRGTIDKTLFLKKDKHDIILVQVYVDDIIFGSTKKSWCDEFEALMKSRFQMSSMGELTFFLGLQVKQKPNGIFISQDKYVAEILKKFDFASVKTASTPIETQKPLVKDEEASDVDAHLYRSMIGSLMYVTASRPDIMFAVCACSRFQVTPKTSHLSAVKRIFRYLKGKPKLGLWYPRESSFDLESYSDSDYAGANLDRKSTTGGCQFLGRRLITWQCKKQTIVATSTECQICCMLQAAVGKSKNSLVKHFEDMRLCRPSKEYLQDEGASSERLSDEQPSPSPAPTSEVPNESLPDSSSAQPEVEFLYGTYGGEFGDHSSMIIPFRNRLTDSQNVYDLSYLKRSPCRAKIPTEEFSRTHRVHKESVSKQGRKKAKGESSVQRDPLEGRTKEMVDEDKEFDEDRLSTEDVVSTDKEGVSTDFEGKLELTDQYRLYKIILTLKLFPKIVTKITEEKKIEEEDESDVKMMMIKEGIRKDSLQRREIHSESKEESQGEDKGEEEYRKRECTGLVVHMLIEKKYPLKKEIVMQMLKLKLESEEESTMALELIRFIKKVLADLESKE